MAQGPYDPYSSPQDARQSSAGNVTGPAIGLIVVAFINILLALWMIVSGLLGTAVQPPQPPGFQRDPAAARAYELGQKLGPAMVVVLGVIGLVGAAVMIYGAIQMMRLRSYGLAMGASIISMIPVASCCCIAGLPIGIWSLIVLNNPEVKSAFQ